MATTERRGVTDGRTPAVTGSSVLLLLLAAPTPPVAPPVAVWARRAVAPSPISAHRAERLLLSAPYLCLPRAASCLLQASRPASSRLPYYDIQHAQLMSSSEQLRAAPVRVVSLTLAFGGCFSPGRYFTKPSLPTRCRVCMTRLKVGFLSIKWLRGLSQHGVSDPPLFLQAGVRGGEV